MLPALINTAAMIVIIGFFFRWITVKWPESGIGKALAFVY